MRPIGIDLGTTYSAIATIGVGGQPEIIRNNMGQATTPSVVMLESTGEVLVGQEAKQQRVMAPGDIIEFVKRQMGNPTWAFHGDTEQYSAVAVSAIILRQLVKDASEVLGEDISSVVITVPAYFKDGQRNATKQAGEMAGLEVLQVINEPVAAAMSYGVTRGFTGTMLVYDLGGGTFDVTVVRVANGSTFDILAHEGDSQLGGFDFDNLIINWATSEFEAQTGTPVEDTLEMQAQLRDRCEQAKHKLSQVDKAPIFISSGGQNVKLVLTREKFEQLASSLLATTEDITLDVLDAAGITKAQVDKVLLVGGSTRMPMVKRMLTELMGQEPDQTVHPDEAVALGAAVAADVNGVQRQGAQQQTASAAPIVLHDVTSHSLGVKSLNEQGFLANTVIIEANTHIPCQVRRTFFTTADNQTDLHVQVTVGDGTDLRYVEDLGDSHLKIPPHPQQSPVEVIYSCDIDGMMHVEVIDLVDNNRLGEFEVERPGAVDQGEVDRMRDALASLDFQ
ncbi:Hsp70 family protein [Gordonia iterans]|nr:Hsp70 family protein [Gordonia iterans]